jgi:GGDEF domain-containing protein
LKFSEIILLTARHDAVERGRSADKPVSLLMLESTLYKEYNDRFGHVVGDQVFCAPVKANQNELQQG